jgi:hypothetical protein
MWAAKVVASGGGINGTADGGMSNVAGESVTRGGPETER